MPVQPYLSFDGRCEEAIDFYRAALDAEVTQLMRFSDMPVPATPGMVPPGSEHKIMHSAFRIAGTELLASDGQCSGKAVFSGTSLALVLPDDAHAERAFAALADGGRVNMPLAPSFFSSSFGMVTDRFGVSWMITVAPSAA
jgi:PhnB protein